MSSALFSLFVNISNTIQTTPTSRHDIGLTVSMALLWTQHEHQNLFTMSHASLIVYLIPANDALYSDLGRAA